MELPITARFKRAWNAFRNRDPTYGYYDYGPGYGSRPDRFRFTRGNERSIITSVYNRIALDASAMSMKHVRLDDNGRFLSDMNSGLNRCLTLEANLDQTGSAFMQDVIQSMMDEGCVAIVPVDTDDDPEKGYGSTEILSLRTGKILEWYPAHVRLRVYNERSGQQEEIRMAKSEIAIVENPLYAVMNEPNSTMQRLVRKLNILDAIDNQSGSGKLDMIIHVPYATKSKIQQEYAEQRRKEIEEQLNNSKYGIAWAGLSERITQLNRPIENNLMGQVEYLTSMLYSQLGITQSILDGSADSATMLNYYNRTIEPILSAIADEMKRKFLTKTARSQHQSVEFFRDPFKLVPVNDIAEIADKFTRNEIMTSNEIRQIVGMLPSKDPNADELRNKNLSQSSADIEKRANNQGDTDKEDTQENDEKEE